MKPINVVSTFNGMGNIWIALDRAGTKVNKRYSSEVDKYATQVNDKNYPDTIQLGDITKWREWSIDWSSIDLLAGGSPCQGFSSAGKQGGTRAVLNGIEIVVPDRKTYLYMKSEGAEFLSHSYLFWEFVLLLDHIKKVNPHIEFLLENVRMLNENMNMISTALEVEPVFVNSAMVSAQSRPRFYWTSWDFTLPNDKDIKLIDILDDSTDDKYYLSSKGVSYMNRKVSGGRSHWDFQHHSDSANPKSKCLTANTRKGIPYNVLVCGRIVGMRINPITGKRDDYNKDIPAIQRFESRVDGRSGTLTTVSKDNILGSEDGIAVRAFTPVECERLQTVPDNYTDCVSNSQRYKMLGNGWTVDVIAHILSFMKE